MSSIKSSQRPRSWLNSEEDMEHAAEKSSSHTALRELDDQGRRHNKLLEYGSHKSLETKPPLDSRRVPRLGLLLLIIFVVGVQAYHISFSVFSIEPTVKKDQLLIQQDNADGQRQDSSEIYEFVEEDIEANTTKVTTTVPKAVSQENREKLSNINFELPLIDALPTELAYYANVTDQPRKFTDKPVFWHIPRAGGGSIVKQMASQCLKLVQASDVGPAVNPQAIQSKELMVITDLLSGTSFLNVDTTWDKGIERAKALGLAKSNLVDLIVVRYVFEAGSLFDPLHRGRLFTVMRHPVERAISVYYTMKEASKYDSQIKKLLNGMSLEKYAGSNIAENNWMTRFLSNKLSGELMPAHEALAREVLAQKFFIGLLSEKQQSVERFMRYFGWTTNDPGAEACIDRLVGWKWINRNGLTHPEVKENSKTWKLLEEQNTFDIRLFRYAETLFRSQSSLFE